MRQTQLSTEGIRAMKENVNLFVNWMAYNKEITANDASDKRSRRKKTQIMDR